LISDERRENSLGQRIGPEFSLQQRSHQQDFNDPVAEQVKGHEILAAQRQVLRGVVNRAGDQVAPVFG